jgi:chromosomal replication initiator protein
LRTDSPRQVWETVLGQLELQVTRPNFETWLRNTEGLRLEADEFVVGVPSDFVAEWLRSRMRTLIGRVVAQHVGRQVSVAFQVFGAPAAAANGRLEHATPAASNLDPRLTFDSFVATKSNRLAYRSARQVAADDASYNPLILTGAPGLGKTHLLHAIAHAAGQRRALLISGEEFVRRYGNAVRTGEPHSFRELFRECELLLLDDVAFLASRAASQEQFLHIFNSLHGAGRRIVVTADTDPQSIGGLSNRLRSRLQAGLCVELHTPSPDERLAVLRSKNGVLGHELPDQALAAIAQQPLESIRELEGALNRVAAYAGISDAPLSPDTILKALFPFQPAKSPPPLTPDMVLEAVSRHFQLSPEQITGQSRARDIAYARHVTMYLLRLHAGQSLSQIGKLLGGRDHSTVVSGQQRIESELNARPETQSDVQLIEAQLRAEPAA